MNRRLSSALCAVYRTVHAAAVRISRDCVFAYAGQVAFFIIISAIPFFLLLFSALRVLVPQELPIVLDFFVRFLPGNIPDAVEQVMAALQREANIPVLSASGVALLWASSRGIRSLCEGIRNVYGTRFALSFWKKYLLSVLLTLLLLVSIVALLTGFLLRDRLQLPSAEEFPLLIGIRFLLDLFGIACLFVLLFAFLAPEEIPLRAHGVGALLAALGWNGFSWGYTLYVGAVADVSFLYGSLSAAVVMMLWVYFSIAILLLGAEMNTWLWHVRKM